MVDAESISDFHHWNRYTENGARFFMMHIHKKLSYNVNLQNQKFQMYYWGGKNQKRQALQQVARRHSKIWPMFKI